MRITWRSAGLALSAICATALPAHAGDFRVLYAEPIALRAEDARNAVAASEAGAPQAISFQAYGRQFDLELQSNARLLSKLEPERQAALSRYELLRGRLSGLPGSWVRLTRIGSELHGAIWDGNDLYFIEPARITARFAVSPLAASGSASVVYRLSDTQSDLGPQFCDVRSTGKESTALTAYKALIAELGANAALATVPGSQIEVAVLGDFEFFTKYQLENPQGVLLSTMNIVDGIYSSQVGVTILVPVVTVFSNAGDPFSNTTVPSDLLQELGTYRASTPDVRSRGLAHLITGRNLFGNTAGIAYLDSLCETSMGVGLTDDSFGNANTPLIAAHEIGHNFGAPHDAEPGSACAGVPGNFIMAPDVNGSSTFSQCSLDQMRPRIAAAACVTRSSIGDAAVTIDPTTIRGLTGDNVPFAVNVNSVGTAPVRDVVVTIRSPVGPFVSASVAGGTCSILGADATCQLSTIDDGTSRRIDVVARYPEVITAEIQAALTSSNDRDATNNLARAQVIIDAAADARAAISPTSINALTRQVFALTGTVSAAGPRASENVVATVKILAPEISVVSASSDAGSCTTDFISATCAFGTMAPGDSHRVDVQYRGLRADQMTATASVTSSNDGQRINNSAFATIVLAPARDVTVVPDTVSLIAQLDRPFTLSGQVRSVGPETVNDVTATVVVPS
ncbi:MAG TPA: M12 family metallo-peptidase, partial [Steroidobacteraceae bacterium]|nr:M12 family metallo-peptidase [Steroidobacteraceae bacterium]